MNFFTDFSFQESEYKIAIDDSVFSIGSCFATELYDRLCEGQIEAYNNPFGTVFNPFSITKSLKNICENKYYSEADLIQYHNLFLSLDHHSKFDAQTAEDCLSKINLEIKKANEFLKKSRWIIITYGTSFVYEYHSIRKIVANCHKIPNRDFTKRMLTHQEICDSIRDCIQIIEKNAQPDAHILFSISPVRHLKDGFVENQKSKSRLFDCLHETIENHPNCTYLPVYEVVMDVLRDYRFYKEDRIHPTPEAVTFVFEKFLKAYCSEVTQLFINDNQKIQKALEHRPIVFNTAENRLFLDKIKIKIAQQRNKTNRLIFPNF